MLSYVLASDDPVSWAVEQPVPMPLGAGLAREAPLVRAPSLL